MEKRYIKQVDLRKEIGISQQLMSKLCKTRFKPAMRGKAIDANHPLISEYIEEKRAKESAKDAESGGGGSTREEATVSFDEIENLTVQEVVMRHGSVAGFKTYIDALRGMADWKNKELKYMRDRGKLVEIEPLASSLFALVDLSFKRVVGEFPGSVAPQLKAIVQSQSDDDIIRMTSLMEKTLSQIIKDCKSKIIQDLEREKKKIKIY